VYKATQQQTKQHNKRLILKTIYAQHDISRANIARATSLTRTTVSNNVSELIEDGLVAEIGHGESRGGKRPILLSLVDNARNLIGIDLGNSEFRGGIFDLRGNILHCVNAHVNDCLGQDAVQLLYDLIDRLTALCTQQIAGIAIGTPGVTDATRGVVYEAVNLGWHNIPLKELLEERYPFPIHVANDSQVAALGEYIFGQNREMPNLVVVKAGRGISAGVVLDGRLYIGERSGQGEIGHVVVEENGLLCRCGQRGCLETVASTRAIVERAQLLALGDINSPLRHLSPLPDYLTTDNIFTAFEAGDEAVRDIITDAGRYLGVAIAHLVALLNIQHIVIGGRMARFGQWLVDAIEQELSCRVLPKIAEETDISVSQLGEDIVIQGSAALLLSRELELV
jgi:glucokinase-like ROK family protein